MKDVPGTHFIASTWLAMPPTLPLLLMCSLPLLLLLPLCLPSLPPLLLLLPPVGH